MVPTATPAEMQRDAENLEISKYRNWFETAEANGDQLGMCKSAAALALLRGRQGEAKAHKYWLTKQHENCKTAGWNGKSVDG